MNRETYYRECQRTCPDLGNLKDNINHMSAGVLTEFGELLDIYKKELAYKKAVDRPNLVEECGDIFWYLYNSLNFLSPLGLKILIEGNEIIDEAGPKKEYLDMLERSFNEGYSNLNIVTSCLLSMTDTAIEFFDYEDFGVVENTLLASHVASMIIMWEETIKFLGVDPEESYERNINKLKVRFPEKFSEEHALLRDLKAERKTLE
jgi:hypothetical protein